jgi:thiol-disulfide isomerase/thioredoxin
MLFCIVGIQVLGNTADPKAAAAYNAGLVAKKAGDNHTAAAEFRKAIDLDRHFIEAHIGYIDAVTLENRANIATRNESPANLHSEMKPLIDLYESWAKEDPSLKGVRKLAQAFGYDPQTEGQYLEILLNSACATSSEVTQYLVQAVAAGNLDANMMLHYARGFRVPQPDRYVETLHGITKRFPSDPAALEALEYLADLAASQPEKQRILEQVRSQFENFASHDVSVYETPSQDSPPAAYNLGMRKLFDIYLQNGDPKALSVAEQMAKASPGDRSWATSFYLQEQLGTESKRLEDNNVVKEARLQLALLEAKSGYDATTPSSEHAYKWMVRWVAESPDEPLNSELRKLGAHLKKSARQIDADIWRAQTEDATQFKNFELSTFDGRKVNLHDLRGKVVLVNFWFPTCGGCREEMPYLEKLVNEYRRKTDKFVLLPVNVVPEQNDDVLPLFARMKLTLAPLKAPDENWELTNYGVSGGPHNFLLDSEGRTIYSRFYALNPEELASVETRIDWLLSHAPKPSSRQ